MISGDGTNIGKKLHVINITFNMLNEGGNAMSADRNHLIAVIRDSENYEKLAQSLADIWKDVSSLKQISLMISLKFHFQLFTFLKL